MDENQVKKHLLDEPKAAQPTQLSQEDPEEKAGEPEKLSQDSSEKGLASESDTSSRIAMPDAVQDQIVVVMPKFERYSEYRSPWLSSKESRTSA